MMKDSKLLAHYFLLRSEDLACKFSRASIIAKNAKKLVRQFDALIDGENNQCALVLKLMMFTGMRVGNIESATGYMTKSKFKPSEFRQTFGVTTLEQKHITVVGNEITFDFLGKKGVQQHITVKNAKLAAQVQRQLNGGQQFVTVTDDNVRSFVKRTLGETFCVKDFRTMYANAVATCEVLNGSKITEVCKCVAARLGNTPAITRKAYIDPKIFKL